MQWKGLYKEKNHPERGDEHFPRQRQRKNKRSLCNKENPCLLMKYLSLDPPEEELILIHHSFHSC